MFSEILQKTYVRSAWSKECSARCQTVEFSPLCIGYPIISGGGILASKMVMGSQSRRQGVGTLQAGHVAMSGAWEQVSAGWLVLFQPPCSHVSPCTGVLRGDGLNSWKDVSFVKHFPSCNITPYLVLMLWVTIRLGLRKITE